MSNKVNEKTKQNKKLIIILTIVAVIILAMFMLVSIFIKTNITDTNTDISKYEDYLKDSEDDGIWTKYNVDESIWPSKITSDMKVKDYTMSFRNIIYAQFVGYLEIKYDIDDYKKEIGRLKEYKSTEYKGNFSVTDVNDKYELVAMYADEYYGFVYALTDNKDTIMYVEMIFTDYILDIDYTKIIPKECVLKGFDASDNNPYRKKMLEELD